MLLKSSKHVPDVLHTSTSCASAKITLFIASPVFWKMLVPCGWSSLTAYPDIIIFISQALEHLFFQTCIGFCYKCRATTYKSSTNPWLIFSHCRKCRQLVHVTLKLTYWDSTASACSWDDTSCGGLGNFEKFIANIWCCRWRTHCAWMESGPWNWVSQNLVKVRRKKIKKT